MNADIAQGQSSQQGITNSMQQYIGITVPQRPLVVRNVNTPDPEGTAFGQLVKIDSRSNAKRHRLPFMQINKKAPV
jgi:hypothetical protein